MTKFWYKRIQGDIAHIDEVPQAWRDEVRRMIEEK